MYAVPLLLALAACSDSTFPCSMDAQCTSGGRAGQCVKSPVSATSWCAFGANNCAEGLRWDVSAGDELAGSCVNTLPDGGSPPDAAQPDLATPDFGAPDLATADATPVSPDLVTPAFTASDTTTTHNLYAIWAKTDNDVYAVGEAGTIVHLHNGTWSTEDAGQWPGVTFYTVTGNPSGDVFAAGSNAMIVHRNMNGTWMVENLQSASTTLFALFATNAIITAVGDETLTRSIASTSWSSQPGPPVAGMRCLWISPTQDIYVGGIGPVIYHTKDYITWTPEQLPSLPVSSFILALWGSSSTDIWAMGDHGTVLHDSGSGWSTHASLGSDRIWNLSGRGPNDIWATSTDGFAYHYEPDGQWHQHVIGAVGTYGISESPGYQPAAASSITSRSSRHRHLGVGYSPRTLRGFHAQDPMPCIGGRRLQHGDLSS